MMVSDDPISRLEFASKEIDRVFGDGFAAQHPELVAIVVQTAASDFAALAIARALQDVAVSLAAPEEAIVPPRELMRARP